MITMSTQAYAVFSRSHGKTSWAAMLLKHICCRHYYRSPCAPTLHPVPSAACRLKEVPGAIPLPLQPPIRRDRHPCTTPSREEATAG